MEGVQNTALEKRAVNSEIWHLIIPLVLENALQIFAGLVTAALVGRLLSTDISAQGISSRLVGIVWCLFKGIGLGATVVVAGHWGIGENNKCRHTIEQTYLAVLPISIVCVAIAVFFPQGILRFFTDDKQILVSAAQYMRVAAWSFPFTAIILTNTAAFNGQGNTKTPMLVAGFFNLVNVVAGYILIFGGLGIQPMGLLGAAWGTLISQAAGAVLGLVLLYTPGGLYGLTKRLDKKLRIDWAELKAVFSTGIPAAFESLFWQFSAVLLSKMILTYGSDTFAAYQLGLQMEMFCDVPSGGFIVAGTTLAVKAISHRDPPLFKMYYRQLMKMALCVLTWGTLILITGSGFFMRVLTDKQTIQEIGARYVFLMGFCQLPQVLNKVYGGFMRAAGHKNMPMIVAGIGIWGIRVPLGILVTWVLHVDITWLWIAFLLDNMIRLIINLIYFRHKRIIDAAET